MVSSERVRAMFDAIAHRYDRANHWLSLGLDLRWRRRMARLLGDLNRGALLDVCTGSGDSVFVFHQSLRLRVGVDFSRPMLALACRKASQRRVSAVWVEADATALPFRAGIFDAVTIAFGLRNLTDPRRGLREFYRVLRPGGRLAVLEFTLPRWQPWRWVFQAYLTHVLPRLGGWITGHRAPYDYLRVSILNFPHYEALLDWMTEAGFTPDRMVPLTGGVATLYLAHRP